MNNILTCLFAFCMAFATIGCNGGPCEVQGCCGDCVCPEGECNCCEDGVCVEGCKCIKCCGEDGCEL